MAQIFRTNGIVLGSRDHREADRFYSVFTDAHGKLELRARGSRKISSKLASHLEPFAVCDLMVVRGRYHDIVAGVERQEAYKNLRGDAEKLSLLSYILHLVDITTKPRQSDPVLFYELRSWLSVLDDAPEISAKRRAFLQASFTLKLLTILGYRPELTRCVSCQSRIARRVYKWHGLKGGVVCELCTTRHSEEWFAARKIQDNTLKLVRFATDEPASDLLHVRIPGELSGEFHDLVESLVVAHFPVLPMMISHDVL